MDHSFKGFTQFDVQVCISLKALKNDSRFENIFAQPFDALKEFID